MVDIKVRIDQNGVLSAKAVDRRTLHEADIIIQQTHRFSHEQLNEMSASLSNLKKGKEIENTHGIFSELYHFRLQNKRTKYEESEKIETEFATCPIYGHGQPESEENEIELGD